jgi:hypothetical protein
MWKIPEIMPQSACDIKLQNPCNLGQLRNSQPTGFARHAFARAFVISRT